MTGHRPTTETKQELKMPHSSKSPVNLLLFIENESKTFGLKEIVTSVYPVNLNLMTYGRLIRISLVTALLILALFIFFIAGNHSWIEKNYAIGFYPKLSAVLRVAFGWIPFSLGDVLYSIVAVSVFWQLGKFVVRLFHKTDSWRKKLAPLLTAAKA